MQRGSIRLQNYDYAQNGAYFVTICAQDRRELFGQIVDAEMKPNRCGEIVSQCWQQIPEHFATVELDDFVVMPNHLHGIVVIASTVGARYIVPLQSEAFGKPVSGSLPTIVRTFKAAASREVRKLRDLGGDSMWQRNYYEHVIRNETSLNGIRQYIQANPSLWAEDRENPARHNHEG